MTRYDDRYDEFGYEREDYDGTLELNEYLTPREVMELLRSGRTPSTRWSSPASCRHSGLGSNGG